MYTIQHFITGIFLLIFCQIAIAQNQEPFLNPGGTRNSAMSVDPLGSGGDINKFGESSVNLGSGDVGFPVSLGSISAGDGVVFNVGATYSSNVEKQVDIWNLELPTGRLGLGWTLSENKIVVDHKESGTKTDDEYFWLTNGSPVKLVFKQYIQAQEEYSLPGDPAIKIIYDPIKEEWKITDGGGVLSYYGGLSSYEGAFWDGWLQGVPPPSNGNSIEWGVKWGNWIGASAKGNQENLAIAWNLRKVQSRAGSFLEFTYQNNLEFVGNPDWNYSITTKKKHTKSCFLSEVKNQFDQKLKFFYQSKLSEEYSDPHQEQAEPDAFQEKLDSVFLSSLCFIDTDTLETTKFTYTFIGTANLKKRLLTGIQKKNNNQLTSPGIKFDYFTEEGSPDKGKIKKLTYPSGGSVEYIYETRSLGRSNREFQVNAPAGYSEPRFWTTDNYTVVTWRNPATNTLILQVYEWVGYWKYSYSTVFSDVQLVVYNDKKVQDFEIFPAKDFFTIIRYYYNGTTVKTVNLVKKNETGGEWVNNSFSFSTKGEATSLTDNENNDANNLTMALNGDHYSFIYCPAMGSFSLFINKNLTWERVDEDNPVFSGIPWLTDVRDYDYGEAMPHRFFASGMNNYIFVHDKKTSNSDSIDKWWMIFLDHNLDIKLGALYRSGTDLTRSWSNYFPTPTSVYELTLNSQEFFFNWDENYTLHEFGLDAVTNKSEIYVTQETIGIGDYEHTPERMFLYSYNGQSLDASSVPLNYMSEVQYFAFGPGFGLVFNPTYTSSEFDKFTELYYNPNTNTFSTNTKTRETKFRHEFLKAGSNFYSSRDTLFFKMPNQGAPFSWTAIGTVPKNLFVYEWDDWYFYSKTGSNFWIMQNDYTTGPNHKNAIIFFKNGGIYQNQQIKVDDNPVFHNLLHDATHYPQISNTFCNSTIISYQNTEFIQNATFLKLHRIVDYGVNGNLTDRPVVSSIVHTGPQDITTTYEYDLATAISDPSGTTGLYHKVTTRQGSGNGYTESYIVNGIPIAEYLKPLLQSGGSNELANLDILKGTTYKNLVFKEDGTQLVSQETKYKTTSFAIGSSHTGYLVRPVLTNALQDGFETIQSQTFDSNGKAVSSFVSNMDGTGTANEIRYASDLAVYPGLLTDYNIDPVVQTVKRVNGNIVSSEVTTWKQWGTYWAPNKTFTWKYKSGQTSIPVFNFSAWSESSNPLPADGWVKTSEILERTPSGLVTVSQDMVGTYASVQYQGTREFPIATYKFAKFRNQEIGADGSYLNFESGNLSTNSDNDFWSFPGGTQEFLTQAEAHTGIYSLQVKGKVSGGSRTIGLSKEFEPTDSKGRYLVSFWYKTESGYTSNTAKLIFHVKGTGTDTSNTSQGFVGSYVSGNRALSTASGWTLVQSVLDLSAATGTGTGYRVLVYLVNNDGNQKSVYIDDMRFAPLLSEVNCKVFDPALLIPTADIGDNNETTFPVYNASNQIVSGVDEYGIVRSVTQTYLSRSGSQTDEFALSEPNAVVTIKASNGGTWNHFNNGTPTGLTLSNVSVLSRQLKHTTLGSEGSITITNATSSDFAVRLSVKNETNLSSLPDYRFSIGSVTIQRDASGWKVNDVVGYQTKTVSDFPVWTDWLVVVKGSNLYFFADGRGIFQIAYTGSLGGVVKFTYGANTQGRVDDILVISKPQISVSYTDGAGRLLQKQGLVGSELIVSGPVYDNIGRAAVQPKPVKYSAPNNKFGYKPGYVTGFNFSTDVISGDIITSNQWNADGNQISGFYPFSRVVYEASPLNRAVTSSRPGLDVNLASGKNPVIRIGNQITQSIVSGVTTSSHAVKEAENDEGLRQIQVKDRLGRGIYQIAGPLATKNKVLTISKQNPEGVIYSRSNQTISWQVTFGIFGDDPPSGGQYRWAYFEIGNSENSHNVVYEYYQIPGSGQNQVQTRSGSFSASVGQSFYCKLYLVSQDGGLIDATATISYLDQDYSISQNEFDEVGNLTAVYTPNYFNVPFSNVSKLSYVQRSGYDAWGRKIWSWTMESDTVRYQYDNNGRLRFQVDAKSENTRPQKDTVCYFKYDKIGRLVEEGFFITDFETLDSIKANNPNFPSSSENPVWKSQFVYDGELSGGVFTLKLKGELIKRSRRNIDTEPTSNSIVETWTFNSKGLVQSKSLNVPVYKTATTYSVNYFYDVNNQVNRIDYPTSSLSVRYSYDDFGRVSKIGTGTDDDYFANYIYDAVSGSVKTENIATSTGATKTISYSYNPLGALSSMSSSMFTETLSYYSGRDGDNLGYYDGKIASVFNSYNWTGGPAVPVYYTLRYKYDKAGRLATANYSGTDLNLDTYDIGVGTNNETAYDMNGNILKIKEGTATAQQHMYYPGKNQVKNINGTTNSDYVYDLNGNMSRTVRPGISKTDFVYDTQSLYTRKVSNLNNSGALIDSTVFTYDGINRRVLKSYKNATNLWYTLYLHGSSDQIMEERYRTGAAGTETIRQYIYGPTGLIAIRDNTTDYFVLKDHLGSTRVAFNGTTGAVVAYFDYTAFGKTARSYESGTIIKYTYTGQERDGETGLMNYKARMYDPSIGRFYSMDPAGQTPSFYNYCGNNPVSFTDPSGEYAIFDDLIVMALGGTINLITNIVSGNVHNPLQGLAYFGVGAVSAETTYYGGPVAGGAVLGAGNSILSQAGSDFDFSKVSLGSVAFSAGFGGITGGIGSKVGEALQPVVDKVLPKITNPILEKVIQRAIGGGLTGFTLGTGISLATGHNLGEAFNEGLTGGALGLATGAIGGAVEGFRQQKTLSESKNEVPEKKVGAKSIKPYQKGREGVNRKIEEIKAQGGKVLGQEITLELDGVRIRIDIAADFNGEIRFYEVKNGQFARNTTNQSIVLPRMLEGHPPVQFFGNNALRAGFPIDAPYTRGYVLIIQKYR